MTRVATWLLISAGLMSAQPPHATRPDTSTERRTGQPPKLLLALGDVSTAANQHDSVSHALVTVEGIGLRAELFDTRIRTDTQLITKQAVTTLNGTLTFYKNLLDFDAVLFFVSGSPRLTPQQKADLLAFVHDDGKGFIVLHSSIAAFRDWPEWKSVIGLASAPEPEEPAANDDNSIRVLKPDVPAMRLFHLSFKARDNVLPVSFAEPNHVRVLAKTETGVPVFWTTSFGKGRVFVSQLGHDDEMWDRKDVQNMILEAVRWTMRMPRPPAPAPLNRQK